MMASAHPRDDVKLMNQIQNTCEVVLSIPVVAAPLLKKPTGTSDATSSVLVELPGSNDISMFSHSKFPDECFAVVCRVQGRLLRNSCEAYFDCQTHSVMVCGVAVNISQDSVGVLDKEFFHQSIIKNRSAVPLILNSISVRSWTTGKPGLRVELLNDDVCDLKEVTRSTNDEISSWSCPNESRLSLGLTLRPDDCYFFSARFHEQQHNAPPITKQGMNFLGGLSISGGKKSPAPQASEPSVNPCIVSFFLGRPRCLWTSGNTYIYGIDSSPVNELVQPSVPSYFRDFCGTYDHDLFVHNIAVLPPNVAVQDIIQITDRDAKSGSISANLSQTQDMSSGAPSVDTITQIMNMRSGFPQDCVVSAELVDSPLAKGSPLTIPRSKHGVARIGYPLTCRYQIKIIHVGKKINEITNISKCSILRFVQDPVRNRTFNYIHIVGIC